MCWLIAEPEAHMETVITTRQGAVRGVHHEGVRIFKGVPYAAPPVGANRFLPPKPMAWAGVRDALAFGPKSRQPAYPPGIKLLLNELTDGGDDCLTLNVWAPAAVATPHPVMVWIPGGMFEFHGTGASPWYDGSRFARDGIVCVTINYRVGADGFLYTGDEHANIGLLDQIAALTWVRDNVAAFGGDPGNVTVFGESAGAMSIAALLAMPRAEGLFQRAILQSGAAHPVMSASAARRVCSNLARKLDVVATREALAGVPVDRLLQAQIELHDELDANPDPQHWGEEVAISLMPWQPVIDGDVIPGSPLDRIAAGAGAGVDILVGTNTDEHRLFLASTGAIERITEGVLTRAIASYGLPVSETLSSYRERHPGGTAGDLLAAVQTDWYWRKPAIRLAEAHARHNPATYMYEFAWRSPQFNGLLGACHALELPFVFDTLGHATDPLWGPNPPQLLADTMHTAWVAFATHGRCSWPAYDATRQATMRLDVASRVVEARDAEETLSERALAGA
jgi:carboxylesterase 2/para-nitrobenzyl esterase